MRVRVQSWMGAKDAPAFWPTRFEQNRDSHCGWMYLLFVRVRNK
jgi:hypothetical protein